MSRAIRNRAQGWETSNRVELYRAEQWLSRLVNLSRHHRRSGRPQPRLVLPLPQHHLRLGNHRILPYSVKRPQLSGNQHHHLVNRLLRFSVDNRNRPLVHNLHRYLVGVNRSQHLALRPAHLCSEDNRSQLLALRPLHLSLQDNLSQLSARRPYLRSE